VPDHSTFSKNRHGRFRACDLHRLLFEQMVAKCAAAGLVAGRDVAVDGSTIMADASREKKLKGTAAVDELRARESVSRPVAEYLAALDAALPPGPDEPASVKPASISPTDPQTALTCKHGPARYAYAIKPLLDLDTDCILDVEATSARFAAEVAGTRTLVSRIGTKLGIAPASLSAGKAYGSGPLLGWLVDRNTTPYIRSSTTVASAMPSSLAMPFATTATPTLIAARQTSYLAIAALPGPAKSASTEAVPPIAPPAT
jgi:hypothetical protein